MRLAPVRSAVLAIRVIAAFAKVHILVLTILFFAVTAGLFYTQTLMGYMLTVGLFAMIADCHITPAVIWYLMVFVLAIFFPAMIAFCIFTSAAIGLMLTMFFAAMIAFGILTSAVIGEYMGYMLAIGLFAMITGCRITPAIIGNLMDFVLAILGSAVFAAGFNTSTVMIRT